MSAVIDPIKAGDDRVNTDRLDALILAELDCPAAAEDGKAPGVPDYFAHHFGIALSVDALLPSPRKRPD